MTAEPMTMPALSAPFPGAVPEPVDETPPANPGRPREEQGQEETFESFAHGLLEATRAESWVHEARRLGTGLGLAALFGGALGLRVGGVAIGSHALGVAAGLTAVAAVASPAFAIVLALVNAPISGFTLARATSGAVARAGLILGGLAPAAALYVVTVEDAITVSVVGFASLALAGAIGVSSFATDLRTPLAAASRDTRRWMTVAMPAFVLFAAVLALRVWWLALPVLTGAR